MFFLIARVGKLPLNDDGKRVIGDNFTIFASPEKPADMIYVDLKLYLVWHGMGCLVVKFRKVISQCPFIMLIRSGSEVTSNWP